MTIIRRFFARILPEPIKVHLRYILFYWPKERIAERKIFQIYSHLIRSGDLVFDIGANKGTMTKMFLRLGAKVISVEPNPDCVKLLKNKFKNNKNVIIVNKGLSNKKGKLDFFICEKADEVSTFSKDWKKGRYSYLEWNKKIKVDITTLNEMIKRYGRPAFCKIDVEGYELNVLKGLKSKIPFISFEFHKEFVKDTEKCIQLLSNLGATQFNFSDHTDPHLNMEKWLNSQELFNFLKKTPNKDLGGDIYIKMEN